MKNHKYEIRNINELTPYANNSRKHSKDQIDLIVKSITEFGFTAPVIIDEQGGIIAGHGRVLAAIQMDLPSAPCIVMSDLTESKKRAYVLADNRLTDMSEWDYDKMMSEVKLLSLDGFNVDDIGFEGLDIDEILSEPIDLPEYIEQPERESHNLTTPDNASSTTGTDPEIAAPNYEPKLAPVSSTKEIDERNIENAAKKLVLDNSTKQEDIVVCPHCLESFSMRA